MTDLRKKAFEIKLSSYDSYTLVADIDLNKLINSLKESEVLGHNVGCVTISGRDNKLLISTKIDYAKRNHGLEEENKKLKQRLEENQQRRFPDNGGKPEVILCGSFDVDTSQSSATKCKCGREKWNHPVSKN